MTCSDVSSGTPSTVHKYGLIGHYIGFENGKADAKLTITVVSIPAAHPYPQAIHAGLHDVRVLTDPVVDPAEPARWWPHRALEPDFWDTTPARDVDLVHLHFGFEHLSPARTREIADLLANRGIPLVVTAHDLDNPHLHDQTDYHAQLAVLLPAARHVLTLSHAAAERIAADYGVTAEVTHHPPIVTDPAAVTPRHRAGSAGVFLKSLRGNVVADPRFYRDLAAAAPVEVYAHADARAPDLEAVVDQWHEPMADRELHATIASHPVAVLPYTRGTHSGWMRMCRDLGVSVAVPDCGCYLSQAGDDGGVSLYRTGDGLDAARAVRELMAAGPVAPPLVPDVAARHGQLYAELAGERG